MYGFKLFFVLFELPFLLAFDTSSENQNSGSFELAKSRTMRAMPASAVYVSTYQKHAKFLFLRANVVCQVFNLACQRVKACQSFKLASQRAKKPASFSASSAKRRANFSTIFQKNFSNFEFFNYA